MRLRAIVTTALLAAVLVSAGCARPGVVSTGGTVDVAVPAVAERSAALTFDLSSSDLKLRGAAAQLVEGTLSYAPGDAKPRWTAGSRESTAGKIATVAFEQGTAAAGGGSRLWDLSLNGGLPTDVAVAQQSGRLDLDLGLVDVKDLEVGSQSGRVKVALGGPHPSLSRARIEAGSGAVTIDASGEYPAVEEFSVVAGSGKVELDLGGAWQKSFTAKVKASSGVVLTLPEKVNVRVVVAPGSGGVSAAGFEREADVWTRPAAKQSPFTLTVEVDAASGPVELKSR